MVTTQHTWRHGRQKQSVRPWARRQNHENTRIKGRLRDRPTFVPDDWPDTFGLPLVDDFVKDVGRHARPLQMVIDNALYLLIGESNVMLREREGTHVRRQRRHRYGGVGPCEHFCPSANVCFVDILDNIFEAELKGVTSIAECPVNRERKRTLIIALVTKLWYSKVVPKIPVMVFPALSSVVPLSSVWE